MQRKIVITIIILAVICKALKQMFCDEATIKQRLMYPLAILFNNAYDDYRERHTFAEIRRPVSVAHIKARLYNERTQALAFALLSA